MEADLVAWIDGRIAEMLSSSRAWASNTESLEFQVVSLLEIRGMLSGHPSTGPTDRSWRKVFALTRVGDDYVSRHFRDDVDDGRFLEAMRAGVRVVVKAQDGEGR